MPQLPGPRGESASRLLGPSASTLGSLAETPCLSSTKLRNCHGDYGDLSGDEGDRSPADYDPGDPYGDYGALSDADYDPGDPYGDYGDLSGGDAESDDDGYGEYEPG